MKKKIYKTVFVFVVILILYLFFDYCNVFSCLKINVSNINTSIFEIFINNGIVIVLFRITYILLDKRNIKKEDNKRKTALTMLKSAYAACYDNINYFNKKENRIAVAKKTNFDELICNEKMFSYFQKIPFEHNNEILSFSTEGVIKPKEYETYLKIQKQYKDFITYAISLYDNYSVALLAREPLKSSLLTAINDIVNDPDYKQRGD